MRDRSFFGATAILRASALSLALVQMSVSAAMAQEPQIASDTNSYDELFAKYLADARASAAPSAAGDDWGWMNGLALDTRARRVNDVLTIRVIESIAGAGSADSATSKDGSAGLSVSSLFGLESKLPSFIDPTSLVARAGNTDFQGRGTTTRAGELTALMSARVVDVLPNGDLVVEGIREIDINGDRQILALTGVVRVADISPDNVVLSPSIGQLRIRYFGEGLIRDNLKPGWIIRILNKIF